MKENERPPIDLKYDEELKNAYLRGFFREGLLVALSAELLQRIRERKKLSILSRLEQLNQDRLARIAGHLVSECEWKMAFENGRTYARQFEGFSWPELMNELLAWVKGANEAVRGLHVDSPEDHRPVLSQLSQHGIALEYFFSAEVDGRRRSLDAAIDLLSKTP
ncbi:hypothetical protein [Burkholderia pyrrocinia]|uniref:hypothetical protein n=1 Tax=Burkholderia pyrrocinia TaxID=60550 RepID=UPI002AB1069D|nr:hypothetical protein [Burkholderia pyrrocinia]